MICGRRLEPLQQVAESTGPLTSLMLPPQMKFTSLLRPLWKDSGPSMGGC